jgi:hypothetical protein
MFAIQVEQRAQFVAVGPMSRVAALIEAQRLPLRQAGRQRLDLPSRHGKKPTCFARPFLALMSAPSGLELLDRSHGVEAQISGVMSKAQGLLST